MNIFDDIDELFKKMKEIIYILKENYNLNYTSMFDPSTFSIIFKSRDKNFVKIKFDERLFNNYCVESLVELIYLNYKEREL